MINLISFILGVIIGGLLMWYYWRRYKTTEVFKQKVEERKDQVVDAIKETIEKAKNKTDE